MTVFWDTYDLRCLIKEPTCYKNPENQSCINPILTNNPTCVQSSCVVETGLSDFLSYSHENKNQPRISTKNNTLQGL